MTRYVALVRAANVGVTGKLPMTELRALCEVAGLQDVRTYIASGNVVFETEADEASVKASLERALHAHAGKRVGVLVRSGAEMAAAVKANPFKAHPANRVVAVFLDEPPPRDWRALVTGRKDEEIDAEGREIFVHYPSGQAETKLKIPAARDGTARNMNTVTKLAEMAA